MAWHDGTVTAPLTPPHQPNPHDPWQAPPSGSHLATAPASGSPDDPDTATELRQAAVVVALVALAGIALGLLWLWLAP
ncbi:ABC transporter permease, partial [Streptomyces sp. WAC04770]